MPNPVEPYSCGMPHFKPGATHKFDGLPVADLKEPFARTNSAISFSDVFMSGAAMYLLGQIGFIAIAKERMISIFFSRVMFFGSATIPDLPPPNGKSAKEHFHV